MSVASFLLVIFSLSHCLPESNIKRNLATKTPYIYVGNKGVKNLEGYGRCEFKQVWMLSRHGTRYPSKKAIMLLVKRLPDLARLVASNFNHVESRVKVSRRVLENIMNWKPFPRGFDATKQSLFLHPEGELEMTLMAERLLRRFPGLLSSYDAKDFKFRATLSQRTEQSQFHFTAGLFNRSVAQTDVKYDEPIPHDPLLRSYKSCPKWQRDVRLNPETRREKTKFENGRIFQTTVLQRLSLILGFQNDSLITISDVDAMYVACVFGQAWNPFSESPWCNLFDDEMMDVLEYREDLQHYWQDSYGHELNAELGCVLMKDVLGNFWNVTHHVPEEKGIFYFTHSGMTLKFLSYLGLFMEEDGQHLKSDNYHEKRSRSFRLTYADSFASNTMFALRRCETQFQVGLLLNEHLVRIPGCGSRLWCPLEDFRSLFETRLKKCDLKTLCFVEGDSQAPTAISDVEGMY